MARNPAISRTAAATLLTVAFALASLAAEQKGGPSDGARDALAQNFQAERFRIDPNDLPAPKTGPIVTDRSLVVPYDRAGAASAAGLHRDAVRHRARQSAAAALAAER